MGNQIPVNTPPETNQTPMASSKESVKIITFIILALVLIGVSIFIGIQIGKGQLLNNNTPITITTSPVPTPNVTNSWKSFKETSISLYGLQLSIPPTWTLKEVNRRPEPTGIADPKTGHDCAEYIIASNDDNAKLSLKPTCGFADGGADLWPDDAVIVKDLGSEKYIIRYFDSTKSVYVYAHATNSANGKLQSRILSFGDNQDFVIIFTELLYTGTESQKNQNLETTDKIISSIRKI